MHRLASALATAVLALAFGHAASAADLRRPAPAPMAPAPAPFSWTGFYIAGHVGWGWTDTDVNVGSAPFLFDTSSFSHSDDGVVGGAQIGYNWQFAPNWVIGIEGDFSGTGIHDSRFGAMTVGGFVIPGAGHALSRDIEWLATIRGRLGYAWDRSLFYITGGGAWAHVNATAASVFPGVSFTHSLSDTLSGWTIGAGYEWAFAQGWSARLEYLYYNFDRHSGTGVPDFAVPFASTIDWDDTKLHVIRVGVNYRFGDYGKAPVVARY